MPVVPIRASTQEHLDIEDVQNDLLLLKDGSAALILQTSSINFGLLSEEEQDATIYSYAALLNSLSLPIQIIIRSERKDVTNYVQLLANQEQKQTNLLLKQQIKSYRLFVEKVVKEGNVLDKKFYVIIPFSAIELGLTTIKKNSRELPFSKEYIIKKALTSLKPKRDHLVRQFARLGLKVTQLKTEEMIKLFYAAYNPESSQNQQFTSSKQYTIPLVQAAIDPSAIPLAKPLP